MEEGTSDFESGYDGIEAPADKPVAQAVVEEVKEQPAPEPEKAEPDPLQELRSQFEQFEKRVRTAEGHIGNLNHHQRLLHETLAASKAATEKVSEAPSQQSVKEAIGRPREWDELTAEFPEWAAATEKLLDARLQKAKGDVDIEALQRQVAERVRNETAASVRKEIVNSSLEAAFPGWEDTVRTEEFKEWTRSQSEDVQKLCASDRVGDAARLLKLYESRTVAKPVQKQSLRQKLVEAAITPKGDGGSSVKRSDIDEFEAAYNSSR